MHAFHSVPPRSFAFMEAAFFIPVRLSFRNLLIYSCFSIQFFLPLLIQCHQNNGFKTFTEIQILETYLTYINTRLTHASLEASATTLSLAFGANA